MATPVSEMSVPFVSLDSARRAADGVDMDTAPWLYETELGYTVSRYEDVVAVLRNQHWHSVVPLAAPGQDAEFDAWMGARQPNLLVMNGEDHKRLRRVVAPWLTPQRVDGFRSMMRDVFLERLASAIDQATCEFISEVCDPYAHQVIFDLVGASVEWRERFRVLSTERAERKITMASPTSEVIEISTAFDQLIDELLADEVLPRTNSFLEIVRLAESEGTISHREGVMLVQNVIAGATDSTSAQLGSAVSLFANFDDEYQLLRDQPVLAATAVEEILRYQGAARGSARIASRAIEYRGVLFPSETTLTVAFVAANRDPAIYPAPLRFNISRTNQAPHLSFGHGAHFCIGAALARAALTEALTLLAERVALIELTGLVEWRPPMVDFWGPASLPVRLHPAP